VSPQEIEPLAATAVLANHKIEVLVILRRLRAPAAVVHDVPRVTGKQKDVPRAQLQRLTASQVFQPCRATDGRVVLVSPGPCSIRQRAP
jgi:hypothetical protein